MILVALLLAGYLALEILWGHSNVVSLLVAGVFLAIAYCSRNGANSRKGSEVQVSSVWAEVTRPAAIAVTSAIAAYVWAIAVTPLVSDSTPGALAIFVPVGLLALVVGWQAWRMFDTLLRRLFL